MVVGFCLVLMFFFVPETFWDRTPRPHSKPRKAAFPSLSRIFSHPTHLEQPQAETTGGDSSADMRKFAIGNAASSTGPHRPTIAERRQQKPQHHVGFADQGTNMDAKPKSSSDSGSYDETRPQLEAAQIADHGHDPHQGAKGIEGNPEVSEPGTPTSQKIAASVAPMGEGPQTPGLHRLNPPFYTTNEKPDTDYMSHTHEASGATLDTPASEKSDPASAGQFDVAGGPRYTAYLRTQPPKTYRQNIKPWNGRLCPDNWFKVALRPFILFAYPSILWSTLVYSLSIGWLIVLSESVAVIFENKETYNFTALQTGLVYISPFIGGVLGTAVAGKVSDIIVRSMSRRNGGIYEPEFRLVMAIPITLATCIGLMGYGWSVEEKDNFMVPAVFFGIISFGCALGSTTAITFAVDSYRQYAGEALVTLNFSKSMCNLTHSQIAFTNEEADIFHGLVFSLFFNRWLEADGAKRTFLAIGGIQLAFLATTVPMYIYGKRARMWTVRKNFMEKF